MALEDVPSKVGAILLAWYPGTEGGNALADVLSGDVSPSGKLPVTFPKTTGQVPLTYNHLPTGRAPMANDRYTSKYVDTLIGPLYPFGFGLSYTTFKYGAPRLTATRLGPNDKLQVAVDVTNTGDRPGKEVVQLSIRTSSWPCGAGRSAELKGFREKRTGAGRDEDSFILAARRRACLFQRGRQPHSGGWRLRLLGR